MTSELVTRHIEITADALPLFCPNPNQTLWSAHPRVAIPVEKLGTAKCPYCGTVYKFKGELPHGH